MEHWLADEPVGAWREPWRLRAGRWARGDKPLVAGAAAGVLVAMLASGAGLWWRGQQRAEQRQAVAAALDELGRLQGQSRWAEARAVLGQAQDRLGEGGPGDLQERLERARRDLGLVTQVDAIRLQRASWVEGRFDTGGADRDYAAAFARGGLGRVGDAPEAVAQRVVDTGVKEALITALDDWATCAGEPSRRVWVLAVARRADPDPWRDRLGDLAVRQDKAALSRLAKEVPAERLTAPLLATIGLSAWPDSADLLRAGQARYPGDFWINYHLAHLLGKSAPEEAVAYYRAAIAVRPKTSAAHNDLGLALWDMGQLDQAIACYRQAIALDPKLARAHYNLGLVLRKKGRVEEAVASYRRAIALDPASPAAYTGLGNALHDKGQVDEALACHRRAIKLAPKLALAHYNLANALKDKGWLEEAIAGWRRATELDPKYVAAHTNLGTALRDKGRVKEAIACYRRAIELDPKHASAHSGLGLALLGQGRVEEALACYRRANALDPKDAKIHVSLGAILCDHKHDYDAAIGAFRRAIELDPKVASAHYNLGNALFGADRLEEAGACFRRAIALDPAYAEAHCNLGAFLRGRGKFAEALASFRRGHELGSKRPGWSNPSAQWVAHCQRLVELDARLLAVLRGDAKPADNAERVALAQLGARYKRLYGAAARFYVDAFAAEPNLAEDLKAAYRYTAACSAALAGSGQGEDAALLAAGERVRWRQQAVAWLRADLGAWAKLREAGKETDRALLRRMLLHWQKDAALAGLRNAAALDKLPDAEQAACRQLWADVADLLKMTGGTGKP